MKKIVFVFINIFMFLVQGLFPMQRRVSFESELQSLSLVNIYPKSKARQFKPKIRATRRDINRALKRLGYERTSQGFKKKVIN